MTLKRLLATTALAALVVTPVFGGVEKEVRDSTIQDVVEREMIYDPGVTSNDVDVMVVNGVVTVSGTVDNILAKERAARLAETVKGVRSVVNRIDVDPAVEQPDDLIRKNVKSVLFEDPATDSYEISVDVDHGHVTLTGTVDSWKERELCATVAKRAYGVLSIENDIDVEFDSSRMDAEIENEIEQALQWNVLVDSGLITVDVDDGAVKLDGIVGSAAEKRHAIGESWTAGVRSVDAEGLLVERWARDDDLRKKSYTEVGDDEIHAAVEAAMVHDPRVVSFDVSTSVHAGTVTLRGVVDNLDAKRAAEQDARNTVGVLAVNNYIKVRPIESRSATAIENDVRRAFERDPYVERFETTVRAADGTVYLNGTVDSHFEKARADNLASKVSGVVSVVNNLHVAGQPYVFDPYLDAWTTYDYYWYDHSDWHTFRTDEEIALDIQSELWWSPFVDADEVTVTVENGVATLEGTVDSRMERAAARENAYEGGATYVRNELDVQSQ